VAVVEQWVLVVQAAVNIQEKMEVLEVGVQKEAQGLLELQDKVVMVALRLTQAANLVAAEAVQVLKEEIVLLVLLVLPVVMEQHHPYQELQ
jgi:tetrahydromethanopterin S-methyltransferase subunit H